MLTESLHRSRRKWTSEGIFEKYWTKSRKGKNAPGEPQGNPPKDSMTKLGTCTITVEPHIFEATMYSVKETSPRLISTTQTPLSRPVLQYGPPDGIVSPLPIQENVALKNLSTLNQPQLNSDGFDNSGSNSFSNKWQVSTPSINGTKSVLSDSSVTTVSIKPPASPPSESSSSNTPRSKPQMTVNRDANLVAKSTDPVIQKLAQQAATDSNLKKLMRLVASGDASPEQLKRFQNHISELTNVEKSQQVTQLPPNKPSCSISTPISNPVKVVTKKSLEPSVQTSNTAPCISKHSHNHNQPPSHSLKCQGPNPSSKSDINGVVLEFANGNGDRYSFPKYSILELIPGTNQALVSFLIIRKGSDAESPSYDPKLDYYQPMTIRIYAHQNRQLEALQKAVESPDEVRTWMNKVMDECQRAEYVLLAMRLPREIDHSSPIEIEDSSSKPDQMNMKVNWVTTNGSCHEPKVKSSKKKASEEETSRGRTNSVAAIS